MKRVFKIFKVLAVAIFFIFLVIISFRISKDIKKKLSYPNTYAIQNVKTGKDIRVFNANYKDETKIILYSHNNWECMTWELIQMKDSTFLLKNLYTQKTFQPSSSPNSGISLWQQPMGGTALQYWEFIKQPDNTFLIRLNESELYVTVASDENNSDLILMTKQDSPSQQWKLVRQNPWK